MNLEYAFLKVLSMSFTASFVILIVLLGRLLLKKSPKIFSYILWAPVLFQLLVPVTFSSLFSLIPREVSNVESRVVVYEKPPIVAEKTDVVESVTRPASLQIKEENSFNPMQLLLLAGSLIWIIVLFGMILKMLYSLWKLKRRLAGSIGIGNNIYISDEIESPFVLGLFKPKVYIPSTVESGDYIILHEQVHIERGDNIIKFLGYIALCVHWFNPFVWLSFILSTKDMEMSCDEAVLRKSKGDIRADYSQSLLNISLGRRFKAVNAIHFSGNDVKGRVRNIMNYRSNKVWKSVLSLILTLVILVGCTTAPPKEEKELPFKNVTLSDITDKMIDDPSTKWVDTHLIYGDEDKVLLKGGFGVLAYSLKESKVMDRVPRRTLDNMYYLGQMGQKLREENPDYLVLASKYGNKLYIPVFEDEVFNLKEGKAYIYDIAKGTFEEGKFVKKDLFNDLVEFTWEEKRLYTKEKSPDDLWENSKSVQLKDNVIYSFIPKDSPPRELEVRVRNNKSGEEKIYKPFIIN